MLTDSQKQDLLRFNLTTAELDVITAEYKKSYPREVIVASLKSVVTKVTPPKVKTADSKSYLGYYEFDVNIDNVFYDLFEVPQGAPLTTLSRTMSEYAVACKLDGYTPKK